METYNIPVRWAVEANVKVKAESLDAAVKQLERSGLAYVDAPTPMYIEGTFEVNLPDLPEDE